MTSTVLDRQNAEFWNEICGSERARSLGISGVSPENLRRFDEEFLRFYPYLEKYVFPEDLKGKRVLEIGLGYGTLGQMLALQGCRYYGLDIAKNPIALMKYRLALLGLQGDLRVGSVLDLPYKDAAFDYVYSIGCLHHAGDLLRAVGEVRRVLSDGGKAIIMLYNRHSFRRVVFLPIVHLRNLLLGRYKPADGQASYADWVRTWYDKNENGKAAPHTEYVSRAQVRRLFRDYRTVRIESQNFDSLVYKGKTHVPREFLLNNLARVAGVDLYITAVK